MAAFSIPLIIYLGLLTGAMGFGAFKWWREPERRARRALIAAPPKPIAAVMDGERVHVKGIARPVGDVGKSPFTGRRCIGYRFLAQERQTEHWAQVHEQSHCDPFEIVDEGSTVRVQGPFVFGLAVNERSNGGSAPSAEMVAALRGFVIRGWPHPLRYREGRLEPGDFVSVVGVVSSVVDRAGQREAPRDSLRLRVISGTEEDPVVLANGDVIEGLNDSWEEG